MLESILKVDVKELVLMILKNHMKHSYKFNANNYLT